MENIITLRETNKIKVLKAERISHIHASGNYVEIHRLDESPIVHRETLRLIYERLNKNLFIRIHKSVVIRLDLIEELRPTGNGDYQIQYENGAQFLLSRRFKESFPLL